MSLAVSYLMALESAKYRKVVTFTDSDMDTHIDSSEKSSLYNVLDSLIIEYNKMPSNSMHVKEIKQYNSREEKK